MGAKETLMQIALIDIKISRLQEEVEKREAAAERVTPVLDKLSVQTSPGNPKEDAMIAYVESKTKLEELIREQLRVKDSIMSALCRVESKQFFEILYCRYFEKKSWNRICEEVHISKNDIFRRHREALTAFEKVCQKK